MQFKYANMEEKREQPQRRVHKTPCITRSASFVWVNTGSSVAVTILPQQLLQQQEGVTATLATCKTLPSITPPPPSQPTLVKQLPFTHRYTEVMRAEWGGRFTL
jgi:hypothetical protein